MKHSQLFIALIFILAITTTANSLLTEKSTFDFDSYEYLQNFLDTTGTGKYLLKRNYSQKQIEKVYDLDSGTATDAAVTGYTKIVTIPNSNDILDIVDDTTIKRISIPAMTEETITLPSPLNEKYDTSKYFFNEDGTILYVSQYAKLQTVDFSGSSYTVSAEIDLSDLCPTFETLEFTTGNTTKYFPNAYLQKVTLFDRSRQNICVLDISDINNITAQNSAVHDDVSFNYTFKGALGGNKFFTRDYTTFNQSVIVDVIDGSTLFTYTIGEDGVNFQQVSKDGQYWIAYLDSDQFMVGKADDYCKYQITAADYPSTDTDDYEYFMDYNTLVVVLNEQTVYTFDLESNWQELNSCTSTSATLSESGEDPENTFSNILGFSIASILIIASIFF